MLKSVVSLFALTLCVQNLESQAMGRGGRASAAPPPTGIEQIQGGMRGGKASVRGVPSSGPQDAFSQHLFAPELVMQNQSAIGLQDAQRTRIIAEMSQAQAKFTEVQWNLSGEEEKLTRLLQEQAPAEQSVMAQLDRILALEQGLKRTQMLLLVRVKNVLTPEQQTTLLQMQRGGGRGAGAPGAAGIGRGGRGGGKVPPTVRDTLPRPGGAR